MERVVTINLNGNPYQLEEPAYDALRSYMSRAETALGDNPDKAEIVHDLEQAIADKCSSYLSPGKSVVSAAEMTRILDEMGTVEGEGGEQPSQQGAPEPNHEPHRPARRLYRIYNNGAWTGVSAGMAAYAGIDVAWVRVFWILTAIFTGGFTALIYLVMIFAVPVASTSEELAAAHGAPFNAQEVVDRAKREYGRFAETSAQNWRHWRREERRWRRSWRQQQRAWESGWGAAQTAAAPAQPVGYVERMFAGLFAFVFSIITAALLIAFLVAFFSLLSNGAVLGWTPPSDVPMWLVLVVLAIAYAAISSPFSALQRTSYATLSGRRTGGATDGLATLAIVVIAGAFAWTYSEEARAFIEQGYVVVRDFVTYWDRQW